MRIWTCANMGLPPGAPPGTPGAPPPGGMVPPPGVPAPPPGPPGGAPMFTIAFRDTRFKWANARLWGTSRKLLESLGLAVLKGFAITACAEAIQYNQVQREKLQSV